MTPRPIPQVTQASRRTQKQELRKSSFFIQFTFAGLAFDDDNSLIQKRHTIQKF